MRGAFNPLASQENAEFYFLSAFSASVSAVKKAFQETKDLRVSTAGVHFLDRAVELTGDRNLGLHLAEHADLGAFDVHFYAMLSSPTLAAAYECLCRSQRLIHDTTQVARWTSRLTTQRCGYELLDVMVTLWTHSNVRLPILIDRVLRYFIVTPDLHRVHHSAWQPETDSNFGAVFPIWDLIFGTYRAEPRDGHEHMRLGLEEVRGRDAHRLFWLLGSVREKRLGSNLGSGEKLLPGLPLDDVEVRS